MKERGQGRPDAHKDKESASPKEQAKPKGESEPVKPKKPWPRLLLVLLR